MEQERDGGGFGMVGVVVGVRASAPARGQVGVSGCGRPEVDGERRPAFGDMNPYVGMMSDDGAASAHPGGAGGGGGAARKRTVRETTPLHETPQAGGVGAVWDERDGQGDDGAGCSASPACSP